MTPQKYKVVSSSKPEFNNIELFFVFDDPQPGKVVEVFGHRFTITQTGKLTVLSSESWVLTLQEITPPEDTPYGRGPIINWRDLRINFEVDVFPSTKKIRLQETDRLTLEHGVIMQALALFLIHNWGQIESAYGIPCPVEWNADYNVMYLRDNWNLDGLSSVQLTRSGSFTRYNEDGRVINFDG